MVDVVCSKRNTIRVKSEELPQTIVKQRFLKLETVTADRVFSFKIGEPTSLKAQ